MNRNPAAPDDRRTFTATIEGIRQPAIDAGLMTAGRSTDRLNVEAAGQWTITIKSA